MSEVNQAELARIFGVSARTIRDWQSKGMPARGDRGERRYETEECIQWRVEQLVERRLGDQQEEDEEADRYPTSEASKRRREAAKAELEEMKVRERRGELIAYGDVADLVIDTAERIRRSLLNLPGRRLKEIVAASELAEAREIRMEAVHEILEELSQMFREAGVDESEEAA